MKFELRRAKDKQFYFVLIARNGKVVATSELYRRLSSAEKTIESICGAYLATAPTVDGPGIKRKRRSDP